AHAAGPGRGAGLAARLHPASGGGPLRLSVQPRHPQGVPPMSRAWLLLIPLLLAGCSILPKAEELQVFQLPGVASPPPVASGSGAGEVLRIGRPRASPLLDSTRI